MSIFKALIVIFIVSQVYYKMERDGTITFTDIPSPGFVPFYKGKTRRYIPYSQIKKVRKMVKEIAELYGIEPEFLLAVVEIESGYDIYAISHKGAIGLMQLMPRIIKRFKVVNPFNPYQNLEAGALYLKELLVEFHRKDLALAAYNAGKNRVYEYGGVPPFRETMNFVRKVLERYYQIKKEGVYGEKNGRRKYKESKKIDDRRRPGRSKGRNRSDTR